MPKLFGETKVQMGLVVAYSDLQHQIFYNEMAKSFGLGTETEISF